MKPFAVVRYRRNSLAGIHIVNKARTRENFVFAQRTELNDVNDYNNNPPDIVWCDDERAADDTCEKLAHEHPGSCWVKMNSGYVQNNTVVKSTVSKSAFSEAGLLPV